MDRRSGGLKTERLAWLCHTSSPVPTVLWRQSFAGVMKQVIAECCTCLARRSGLETERQAVVLTEVRTEIPTAYPNEVRNQHRTAYSAAQTRFSAVLEHAVVGWRGSTGWHLIRPLDRSRVRGKETAVDWGSSSASLRQAALVRAAFARSWDSVDASLR